MHNKYDLTQPIPATATTSKPAALPQKFNRSEQSRINGAKSRGPITSEGKRKCSRGALKHGLTASKHTVLDIEDQAEFQAFLHATIDEFRPQSVFALSLVEQLAHLQWNLDRLRLIETAYLNHKVNETTTFEEEDPLTAAAAGATEIAALVRGWLSATSGASTNALELLRRYSATLQHQFNSTFNNLAKLEKQQAARLRDRDLPYHKPELKPVPKPEPVAPPPALTQTVEPAATKQTQQRRPPHQATTQKLDEKCS